MAKWRERKFTEGPFAGYTYGEVQKLANSSMSTNKQEDRPTTKAERAIISAARKWYLQTEVKQNTNARAVKRGEGAWVWDEELGKAVKVKSENEQTTNPDDRKQVPSSDEFRITQESTSPPPPVANAKPSRTKPRLKGHRSPNRKGPQGTLIKGEPGSLEFAKNVKKAMDAAEKIKDAAKRERVLGPLRELMLTQPHRDLEAIGRYTMMVNEEAKTDTNKFTRDVANWLATPGGGRAGKGETKTRYKPTQKTQDIQKYGEYGYRPPTPTVKPTPTTKKKKPGGRRV